METGSELLDDTAARTGLSGEFEEAYEVGEGEEDFSESLIRFDIRETDEDGNILDVDQQNEKSGLKDQTVREMLNALLPPVPVQEGELPTFKCVSADFATREDVVDLQIRLDERLQIRQARETGICPVREELYAQSFDELIREVAIESPERGLLTLRVRDEAKMTIAAYQTLYNTSLAFGLRKAIQAEQGVVELATQIDEKDARVIELKTRVEELRNQYQEQEKQFNEKRTLLNKKRQDEKEFLKHQQHHLQQFLKPQQQQASN
eukprot:418242_1